jgi:hypothetical protein
MAYCDGDEHVDRMREVLNVCKILAGGKLLKVVTCKTDERWKCNIEICLMEMDFERSN